MSTPKGIITLAYSGGLDTSYCVPYLIGEGWTVHAVHINSGGFSQEEVTQLHERALALGATVFESIDITEAYYQKCVRYLVFGNVLRNNTYPLSVSAERPFQALALLDYCRKHGIKAMANGSTGAGNDQVRFDIVFNILAPDIELLTPIRDQRLSRQEEIDYLRARGFDWQEAKKDYSVNQGIWGTSVGGKETLTSHQALPEQAYPSPKVQDEPREIALTFSNGELTAIDGQTASSLALIQQLNTLAGAYAIGRDIHVGDTIIGIKGRVGFEAPAPLIIIKAHELLEKHTLGKWQIHWKKQLSDWYGMMLHEGQYLDPVMRDIEQFLEGTQRSVSGEVYLRLHPYRFELLGIQSPNDLMSAKFGRYGEENLAWTGEDVKGFTRILGNASKLYYSIHPFES